MNTPWLQYDLLNAIDIGVWVYDALTREIIFTNAALEKILGFKPQNDNTGVDFWLEITHPDDRPWVKETIISKLTEQKKVEIEHRIILPNGNIKWISNKKSIKENENGNKVYECLITDITKLKNLEIKFYLSEASYRYLFENNPHPMWIYDVNNYKFLEVNKSALQQYGYSKDEFLSMGILDIRPLEDIDAVKKSVSKVANHENIYYEAGYWRHVTKSGRIINVEISSHELIFSGKSARMVLSKDVTEKLNIEKEILQLNEELKSSEEELRQKLDNALELNEQLLILKGKLETAQQIAQIGSWDWDLQNKKFFCSDGIYEIFGVDKDEFEITFQSFLSIVHPLDVEHSLHAHKNLDNGLNIEYRIIRPDNGQVRYVHSIGKVAKQNGKIIKVIGTTQDITVRKLYELKLEQQNHQLTEIAKISAHKIRRPVSSILGLVSLFEKQELQADINYQVIELIEQATLELDQVIHEIVAKTQ